LYFQNQDQTFAQGFLFLLEDIVGCKLLFSTRIPGLPI